MVETIGNILQIIVLGICTAVAAYNTESRKNRSWLIYGLFAFSFLLGDIWWLLDWLFYEDEFYSIIPYINWKASFLFLILLMQRQLKTPIFRKINNPVLCMIPLFCTGMCFYYMKFGAYIDNLLTALLMCLLIWITVQRLLEIRSGEGGSAEDKSLCLLVFLFCVSEYIIWTASCLDYGNPLRSLYDIFSFVMTVIFLLIIPAMKKAVKADELY